MGSFLSLIYSHSPLIIFFFALLLWSKLSFFLLCSFSVLLTLLSRSRMISLLYSSACLRSLVFFCQFWYLDLAFHLFQCLWNQQVRCYGFWRICVANSTLDGKSAPPLPCNLVAGAVLSKSFFLTLLLVRYNCPAAVVAGFWYSSSFLYWIGVFLSWYFCFTRSDKGSF